MQPASISSRFAAMNLDMIIFGILWQAVSLSLENFVPEVATLEAQAPLWLFFSLFYFVYPTKSAGQTLGKKLLSLKVVPRDDDKGGLTWGQAILREIVGKTLSTLPLWLGYLWARFAKDQRAWHDYMGGTRVISLIWEEEKTFLQKLQHFMLGILSIPLGVALILGVFLYTALPLDSIKEKIEASGIQVGSLTGSLAGGLHFSEIKRQDQEQSFALGSVDVKFNLSALVFEKVFIIEKLSAEEGQIEVPEDFSWATIFMNLLAMSQAPEGNQRWSMEKFKMGKLHLKNMSMENNKKVLSRLREFSLKNLEIADKELHISEGQFQIEGLTVKVQDFKSAFGRIDIAAATGGISPEFLPLLKVPVDFHVNGTIGRNPKANRLSGGLMIDKIRFTYENEKITATVDKLILNEMFKTAMPLEELDLKLSAAGENTLEMMSSLSVEYGIKVCGNEFKPEAEKGPLYTESDRQFQFKMVPKPVADFSKVVFAAEASLEDLFLYELQGQKKLAPDFTSSQEMWAALCFKKSLAALQPEEQEALKKFEKATKPIAGGAGLQALLSQAVPITVPKPTPEPAERVGEVMGEARNLLRSGRYVEAKALLEGVTVSAETFSAADLGAFHNLKAWVYLYSNQPTEAAQNFELAFNARKDVGDAEGLLRANENLKNDQEAKKWFEYLKATLKQNPELMTHLTPNLQKKILSEAAGELPP